MTVVRMTAGRSENRDLFMKPLFAVRGRTMPASGIAAIATGKAGRNCWNSNRWWLSLSPLRFQTPAWDPDRGRLLEAVAPSSNRELCRRPAVARLAQAETANPQAPG